MKITPELERKIHIAIDNKYASQRTALDKLYAERKEEQLAKIQPELEQLLSNPYAVALCGSGRYYRGNYIAELPTILELVEQKADVLFPELHNWYVEETQKRNAAQHQETENLKIAITYSKDFDGIKDTFAKAGLTF